MAKRKTSPESPAPVLSAENPSLADWLLKWALRIILLPFGLILLLDIAVSQRIGIPENRIILAALFDPVYQTFILTLTVTAMMMHNFTRDARSAFRRLLDQGIITGNDKESINSFGELYLRWRKHWSRYLLGLIFAAVGLVFSYYISFDENLARLIPTHQPMDVSRFAIEFWLSNILISGGIILNLLLVGLWVFELIITAALIYRAPEFFDLRVQTAHPDQCGGFKVVGDLCLKMVYILLIPTFFVILWLYVSKHLALSPELASLIPSYMLEFGFRTPSKVVLGILVISGIAVFFWPMYTVHRRMVDERLQLQHKLDRIASRIQQLMSTLLADPGTMPTEKREGILAEIASLKELYASVQNSPTWPINRSLLFKFITSQTIPIISLVRLGGGPLGRLLDIVLGLFSE